MPLRIPNRDARRLWLDAQGLSSTPTGPLDLLGTIDRLGFVQLDTVRTVARAHHHILWSRNQNYREPMLWKLLAKDRAVFEHFTHDASILPIATYPWWRRQFARLKKSLRRWEERGVMPDAHGRAALIARIEAEGPLASHDFESGPRSGTGWNRPPHKYGLDYLWYAGELATSHREKFVKYYDLAHRVIPAEAREAAPSDEEQIDWLCQGALDRLGFGSEGDIMRFWEAASLDEVRAWARAGRGELIDVEIESAAGGSIRALAPADIEDRLASAPAPTSRLRILNPFDPAVRDRQRLERLFGFDYRIEIFVPAAKRRWGYYVFPILEGDRFVGRIEAKADRKSAVLTVLRVWPEDGVRWPASRWDRLDAELDRLARFVDSNAVDWEPEALSERT